MNSKDSCTKSAKGSRGKSKKKAEPVQEEVEVFGEEVFLQMLSSQYMWGDEYKHASFPLEEMTVDEMLIFLSELRNKYPNYHLTFKMERSPRMFGEVNWWELKGIRRENG